MDEDKCLIIKIIAEEKSITRAAKKLHMSQPALTYKLRMLENEIGSELFERTAKGVTLTKTGVLVLEYALDNLERYERLNQVIRSDCEHLNPTIRVGVFGMYAYDEFKDILRLFKKRYPEIEVLLRVGINSKVIEWLNIGAIDIAIIVKDSMMSENCRFLTNGNAYVMYYKPFEIEDCENIDRVLYMPKSKEIEEILDKWWRENFTTPCKIGIGVDDIDLLYQSVKLGLGWASLCSVSRKYWIKEFTYRQLFFKNGEKVVYPIYVNYDIKSIKQDAVRAFCNEILNWYDQPNI